MNLKWLYKILGNNKFKQRGDLMIETDDDVEADIIAKCFNDGTVCCSVDETGKITYKD